MCSTQGLIKRSPAPLSAPRFPLKPVALYSRPGDENRAIAIGDFGRGISRPTDRLDDLVAGQLTRLFQGNGEDFTIQIHIGAAHRVFFLKGLIERNRAKITDQTI